MVGDFVTWSQAIDVTGEGSVLDAVVLAHAAPTEASLGVQDGG